MTYCALIKKLLGSKMYDLGSKINKSGHLKLGFCLFGILLKLEFIKSNQCGWQIGKKIKYLLLHAKMNFLN